MDNSFVEKTIAFFRLLPSEKERGYESKLSKYAQNNQDPQCIAAYRQIMTSGAYGSFEAFFCLETIYRHNRDYSILWELIEEARKIEDFASHFMFKHAEIMFNVHSETLYDYNDLLRRAHLQACELYDNAGFQHTFANAFATICEKCLAEDRDRIVQEWYDSARFCVDRAISLDPKYAKFYSTKARIAAIGHNFDEADELLLHAIDYERSDKKDYALLIGNYQYYRTMVALLRQQYQIQLSLRKQNSVPVERDKMPKNFRANRAFAFVSYAHADSERVIPILSDLSQKNTNYWYDAEIEPGMSWADEIAIHIAQCDMFLLMLTSSSIHSLNVRNEITMAQNHGKRIVPIFLEQVHLSPGAELQLQNYHWILQYSLSREAFAAKLAAALLDCVGPCPSGPEQRTSSAGSATAEPKEKSGRVLERFSRSKSGREEENEDLLFEDENFLAVFDGATSKNQHKLDGRSEGQVTVRCLAEFIRQPGFDRWIDGKTAVSLLQSKLCAYEKEQRLQERGMHLCASGVIYSKARRQIWSVGDCQYMIDGKLTFKAKRVDEVMSMARSMAIHCLLLAGKTEKDIEQDDEARGMILQMLKNQHYLENTEGEFGYSVFSGKGTITDMDVVDVPPGTEVILASDGYPVLKRTLAESEAKLRELVDSDPLCYKEYRSTKGLVAGNESFDDRTYLRFIAD